MSSPSSKPDLSSDDSSKRRRRLVDDPTCSTQNRLEAAFERKQYLLQELEKEFTKEKADPKTDQAPKELQDYGSGSSDSLLILSDDCIKTIFPFCDWVSHLRLEVTCKRLNRLSQAEWKIRHQNIDQCSKWIDRNDEGGGVDDDAPPSCCNCWECL